MSSLSVSVHLFTVEGLTLVLYCLLTGRSKGEARNYVSSSKSIFYLESLFTSLLLSICVFLSSGMWLLGNNLFPDCS